MAVSDGLPGKEKRAERAAAGSCPIGNGAVTSAVLVHLRVEPAHFVVKAMTNVSSATPTSFDGAVAMVKFVADSILYDDNQMRLKMPTSLADNCELLFRAYNVFMKAKTTGRPRLLLEAVKAEQARRRAA